MKNKPIIPLILFSVIISSCANNYESEQKKLVNKKHVQDSIARAWVDKKIADSIAAHK